MLLCTEDKYGVLLTFASDRRVIFPSPNTQPEAVRSHTWEKNLRRGGTGPWTLAVGGAGGGAQLLTQVEAIAGDAGHVGMKGLSPGRSRFQRQPHL